MASKIKVTRQKVEMLEKEGPETPVCTENLNPNVAVMKPAEDRVRRDVPNPLNGTKGRRIFVQ